MGFVGIFFYINDDIVYESTSIDEAEKYGDFKVHKKGHFIMPPIVKTIFQLF